MRVLAEERIKYQTQELENFYNFIADKAKRQYNE